MKRAPAGKDPASPRPGAVREERARRERSRETRSPPGRGRSIPGEWEIIAVVLAHDHRLPREGIRCLLESQPGVRVVGEARDGIEALRAVERLAPDVLVIDGSVPALGGIEVARRVARARSGPGVVVISASGGLPGAWHALRNGAHGFVSLDSSLDHLVAAIRESAAGRRYLSPPLTEHALEEYGKRIGRRGDDPLETLTAREREVLQLSAEGHSSSAIASRLGISPRTVEVHRAHVMDKLALRGRAALVRFALERHLLHSAPAVPEPAAPGRSPRRTPARRKPRRRRP